LVQALSEEWFPFGIRINCLNPERTKTPMRTKSFGTEPEASLLKPDIVAVASINTLISTLTGEVIDVRR
jgi:2-C-methyl-D-erythritol 4-phosphate cytidylyltransferase